MLRRCVSQVASRNSAFRIPLQTKHQLPLYLSSRRAFSVSPKNQPPKPQPASKPTEPKSKLPVIIAGGLLVSSVFAYYYGGLDKYLRSDVPNSKTDDLKRDVETHLEESLPEDSIKTEVNSKLLAKDSVGPTDETLNNIQEKDISDVFTSGVALDHETNKPAEESSGLASSEVKPDEEPNKEFGTPVDVPIINSDESSDLISLEVKPDEQQNEEIETTPTYSSAEKAPEQVEIESVQSEQVASPGVQEVVQVDEVHKSDSLLDDYNLRENSKDIAAPAPDKQKDITTPEDAYDGYIKDGKLVLDFLQAIHAAEDRQAELDAHFFDREKRAIKEKFEKELKDSRARELMYAERETILEKELIKAQIKSAAALKSLQEKLEGELKTKIERKDAEIEEKLKDLQDLAKAKLAAAIASEKTSQIEKMAEANLHINALCLAFYARSEEARESYSAHKLALGALSLEDALSKGLPIKQEIQDLNTHLEGSNKDPLIALVLSSIPEDTKKNGADTLPQLDYKFEAMKGKLRHYSLIPPGGGGILSHSVAGVASRLKVKEMDESGDGIESVINRVENLLAQGKLVDAANALENGVQDSQAAEIAQEWVQRAKNRAITDQALTVLQSYATSVSPI